MSSLEEHDAEQAEITAACEAGECDHPECHEDRCRTCSGEYSDGSDGFDGECPDCADASYMNEIVSRSAPRWAWDLIDETLAMDSESKAFDQDLRRSIKQAINAMGLACERADDQPISREEADDAEI